ncbi:uncharacterized protein FRV6_16810 [Fusarium oxysporum]|uniref:Uncharacterized protein n=1 Tax=Fusarium oxysporum TaxID=5507 RepID=A0A2H3TVM6_FUSOX|nr:uncharacterized protein FRV6_16810 [Fusarium oxysporum]
MSSKDSTGVHRPTRGVRRKRNEYALIAWYAVSVALAAKILICGHVNAAQSADPSVAIHVVATYRLHWYRIL